MREVSSGLWDSGQCMGGIAEISVRGERGAEITLVYREALDENGKLLDPEHYAEHFQTDRYTEAAKLDVSPEPDSVIRVFMAFKAVDGPVDVAEPELQPVERKGFTVVEWGGAEAGR